MQPHIAAGEACLGHFDLLTVVYYWRPLIQKHPRPSEPSNETGYAPSWKPKDNPSREPESLTVQQENAPEDSHDELPHPYKSRPD